MRTVREDGDLSVAVANIAKDAWAAAEAFTMAFDEHEKLAKAGVHLRAPVNKLRDLWCEMLPSLEAPPAKLPTSYRSRVARAYHTQGQDLDWWRKVFTRVKATPFLMGDNRMGWRVTLLWLMEHIADVLDGRYQAIVMRSASDQHIEARRRRIQAAFDKEKKS